MESTRNREVMTSSQVAGNSDFSLFDEISNLLEWAHNRAAPLAFAGLSIAALLWTDFIRYFSIPVSYFSAGLIAGLPALFATVTFAVMMLSINIVMPSFILWTPIFTKGPSLASIYRPKVPSNSPDELIATDPQTSRVQSATSKKFASLINRWIAYSVFVGALWALWVASTIWHLDWRPELVLVAIFFVSVAMGLLVFKEPIFEREKRPSWGFLMHFVTGLSLQTAVAFLVLYVFLKTMTDTETSSLVTGAVLYATVMVFIGLLQLLTAKRVSLGPYPGILRHATLIVIGAMSIISAVTPAGAMLASYTLKTTSSDGDACVVLSFAPTATGLTEPMPELLADGSHVQSAELGFATHLDGYYFVKRAATSSSVYPIPDSRVSRVSSCKSVKKVAGPSEKPSDKTETPGH
jgi:hypothetical protein